MGRSTTAKKIATPNIPFGDLQPADAAFAGIDFHKRFSVVTLGTLKGDQIGQYRLSNQEDEIRTFFGHLPRLVCAIENCRGNEWFVDLLRNCGHEVKVGNTFAIRLIADSCKKNDKIDSKILMDLVARNYLPVCYQPSRDERILREKLRWRTKLMRSRTQYKNVAHSVLDKENKASKLSSTLARNRLQDNSGLSLERQEQLKNCLEVIDYMEHKMCQRDRELLRIAKRDDRIRRLKTIPGVGDISALMLVAELGDINRFKSARHVAGFIGLVPRLYATSDTRRLGPITKRGPGLLRRILVQDAWMAIRTSKLFAQKYSAILKRRGKKVAIVAIARKIAEIAYHLLKHDQEFDENKMLLG